MADNFSEIITTLENSLDSILKKKVNGDLFQIYPTVITQYLLIKKKKNQKTKLNFLLYNSVKSKKILLKEIPKSFNILRVKSELERLQFDIHRVSQLPY